KTGWERFNDSFEIGGDDFLVTAAPTPTHIWLIASEGGTARRLTSGTWSLPTSHPPGPPAAPIAWSPDGSPIGSTRQPHPPPGEAPRSIEIVKVSDGTIKPFSDRASFPVYSPDGRTLAYTQGTGLNDVFVAPASGIPAGGQGRNLTQAI